MESENGIEECLQERLTNITIVKANMLRTLGTLKIFPYSPLKGWREQLDRWHEDLPYFMQMHNLADTPQVNENQRRVMFYMHLFYLSAIVLKGRIVISSCQTAGGDTANLNYSGVMQDTQEAGRAIVDGLGAARNIARLLSILHSRDSVFKMCWLCIFSAHTAFLYLALSISKSYLSSQSADRRLCEDDMKLAKRCYEVLQYCSTTDAVARKFAKGAEETLDILNNSSVQTQLSDPAEIVADMPFIESSTAWGQDNPLLTSLPPASIGLPLHGVATNLLRTLCHPFHTSTASSAGNKVAPIPDTMTSVEEISVGGHLNWSCHIASPYNGVKLSTIQDGSFIGDCKSCGWPN